MIEPTSRYESIESTRHTMPDGEFLKPKFSIWGEPGMSDMIISPAFPRQTRIF